MVGPSVLFQLQQEAQSLFEATGRVFQSSLDPHDIHLANSDSVKMIRTPSGAAPYIEVRSSAFLEGNALEMGDLLWNDMMLNCDYPGKQHEPVGNGTCAMDTTQSTHISIISRFLRTTSDRTT